jgi:hypothetical protein
MKPETKTEANVKQAVPFFLVSNIEESVRYSGHFYKISPFAEV